MDKHAIKWLMVMVYLYIKAQMQFDFIKDNFRTIVNTEQDFNTFKEIFIQENI